MKVMLINGSFRENGSTARALKEVVEELEKQGIETEIIQMGKGTIRDCIDCRVCRTSTTGCVFKDDIVNEIIEKAKDADGFVFGSPVYYAHPSGRILSLLDRVFYAGTAAFAHKPGMAVLAARRGGTTASFDVLNKYFTIAQMPVVSSTYWNMVHGVAQEDVEQDLEGLQVMRNGAKNMAWLLKCIEMGKENGLDAPKADTTHRTNFIR